MRLYLCEKPSQAKDIAPHVGARSRGDGCFTSSDVTVTWAIGHLVELANPEHYNPALSSWDINLLPVVPTDWRLEVKDKTKAQYKIVAGLIKKASEIVVATDADREGEVIARELMQMSGYSGKVSRLWLSSLDDASVKKALTKLLPNEKTLPMYHSGLGRARADWLAGMNMTMALTSAFGSGGKGGVLHCGRVQTPVLALIVRREKAIKHFVPKTHYGLSTKFLMQQVEVSMTWEPNASILDADGHVVNRVHADTARFSVDKKQGRVSFVEKTAEQEIAPLLYSLGELQKEASLRFGMKAQSVLNAAQALYEKHKATSYPRTDCQYLPNSMLVEAETTLEVLCKSNQMLSAYAKTAQMQLKQGSFKTRVFNDKQITAHHAIIPTMNANVDKNAMSDDEARIYDMVCRRYIAQFLGSHLFDKTIIKVECGGERFRVSGKVTTSPGWKVLFPSNKAETTKPNKAKEADAEDETQVLPAVHVGDAALNTLCELQTKATTPPKRYTEGTLLAAMESIDKEIEDPRFKQIMKNKEKAGIGTDATRSSIIEGLFRRDYIAAKGKELVPSDKANELIELIEKIAPELADPVLTAQWEEQLTQIEKGELSLLQFENNLSDWLRHVTDSMKREMGSYSVKASSGRPASTNTYQKAAKSDAEEAQLKYPCPICHKPLKQRTGPRGAFWGCTGYPECKATMPDDNGKPGQKAPEQVKQTPTHVSSKPIKPKAKAGDECPECKKGKLIGRMFKENNKAYIGCDQFPTCRFFAWQES